MDLKIISVALICLVGLSVVRGDDSKKRFNRGVNYRNYVGNPFLINSNLGTQDSSYELLDAEPSGRVVQSPKELRDERILFVNSAPQDQTQSQRNVEQYNFRPSKNDQAPVRYVQSEPSQSVQFRPTQTIEFTSDSSQFQLSQDAQGNYQLKELIGKDAAPRVQETKYSQLQPSEALQHQQTVFKGVEPQKQALQYQFLPQNSERLQGYTQKSEVKNLSPSQQTAPFPAKGTLYYHTNRNGPNPDIGYYQIQKEQQTVTPSSADANLQSVQYLLVDPAQNGQGLRPTETPRFSTVQAHKGEAPYQLFSQNPGQSQPQQQEVKFFQNPKIESLQTNAGAQFQFAKGQYSSGQVQYTQNDAKNNFRPIVLEQNKGADVFQIPQAVQNNQDKSVKNHRRPSPVPDGDVYLRQFLQQHPGSVLIGNQVTLEDNRAQYTLPQNVPSLQTYTTPSPQQLKENKNKEELQSLQELPPKTGSVVFGSLQDKTLSAQYSAYGDQDGFKHQYQQPSQTQHPFGYKQHQLKQEKSPEIQYHFVTKLPQFGPSTESIKTIKTVQYLPTATTSSPNIYLTQAVTNPEETQFKTDNIQLKDSLQFQNGPLRVDEQQEKKGTFTRLLQVSSYPFKPRDPLDSRVYGNQPDFKVYNIPISGDEYQQDGSSKFRPSSELLQFKASDSVTQRVDEIPRIEFGQKHNGDQDAFRPILFQQTTHQSSGQGREPPQIRSDEPSSIYYRPTPSPPVDSTLFQPSSSADNSTRSFEFKQFPPQSHYRLPAFQSNQPSLNQVLYPQQIAASHNVPSRPQYPQFNPFSLYNPDATPKKYSSRIRFTGLQSIPGISNAVQNQPSPVQYQPDPAFQLNQGAAIDATTQHISQPQNIGNEQFAQTDAHFNPFSLHNPDEATKKPLSSEQPPQVEDQPIVKTDKGMVRGKKMTSRSGNLYYAFTSIPYAKPPVGQRRFERPEAAKEWNNVRDGPEDLPACWQRMPFNPTRSNETYGTEDCLYLSVFTPKIDGDEKVPVMVYLHGGSYRAEYPSVSQAEKSKYFMDENIVLVIVKYRLGAFGFLSLEDSALPGNLGLRDAAMALDWVKRNAEVMGGDPSRVTLVGSDAGAAAVQFLMTSPATKDMMSGGISQSGSSTSLWSLSAPGVARYRASRLAEHLGCPVTPDSDMVACLKTRPAYDLANAENIFITGDYDPIAPYQPVIEQGPGCFICESPYKAIVSKPWILGLNKEEGAIKTAWNIMRPDLLKKFYERGADALPEGFMFANTTSYPKEISESILSKYRNLDLTDMWTDGLTFNGMTEALKRSSGPTYFYLFEHRGKATMTDVLAKQTDSKLGNLGVSHGDECLYLFNFEKEYGLTPSPEDTRISKSLIRMWTNFAKFGAPLEDGSWPQYDRGLKQFMRIGTDNLLVDSDLWPDRRSFWENLPLRNILEDLDL